MDRWVVVGAALVLVIAGAAAVVDEPPEGVATEPATDRPAGGAPDASTEESASLGTATAEFDRTRFRIEVFENGSARWQFRYVRTLGTNDTERQQFETFAERFNAEETDLYLDFVDRANALTASAANATGREMTAENFAREARVERGVEDLGVVEMEFTWIAFAAVEADRVVVGDVFDGGLFLGADKSLVIAAGPGLRLADYSPPEGTLNGGSLSDSSRITWQGERDFASGRPRVEFAPASAATTTGNVTTGGETATSDGNGSTGEGGDATPTTTGRQRPATAGDDLPSLLFGVGLVAVLIGVGTVVWARRRDGGGPPVVSSDDGPGTDAPAESPAVSAEELVSDEDRVISMLEDNGGRMRQVRIVEETDWSKSKVSMLLSEMEEEGSISKLRVGRENIISLDGEEPEAAGSPFEDE